MGFQIATANGNLTIEGADVSIKDLDESQVKGTQQEILNMIENMIDQIKKSLISWFL